jgi:hypothetical protein
LAQTGQIAELPWARAAAAQAMQAIKPAPKIPKLARIQVAPIGAIAHLPRAVTRLRRQCPQPPALHSDRRFPKLFASTTALKK